MVVCEELGVPVIKAQTKSLLVKAIRALGIEPDELQERWEDTHEKHEEKEKQRQFELEEREKERQDEL